MKIFVKTLKATKFEIEVKPEDTVADVKKNIETVQGSDVYPTAQQMLIHQGQILKDGTTLEENKVAENSFFVIMLTKSYSGEGSTTSTAATTKAPQSSANPPVTAQASSIYQSPAAQAPSPPQPDTTMPESDVYGQAAVVAGNNLEETIQHLLDMGRGTRDRDTVVRALVAASNDVHRAIRFLYCGVPPSTEAVVVHRAPLGGQTTPPPAQPSQAAQRTSVPSSGPNVNPLHLFPQQRPSVGSNPARANTLNFLHDSNQLLHFFLKSNQFQALRAMVQANPITLQSVLQELGKQNLRLIRLIQEHQLAFLGHLNEPLGGGVGNARSQLAGARPQAFELTPEEHEAIERLESLGFDRAMVLEAFFACNKNEELAANYLLDHTDEFKD